MNFTDFQPMHVLGGQYAVSADPDTVLMTVLGSCVSACIYDPVTNIGGMNHFLLPTSGGLEITDRPERYGELAMRSLVDDLYSFGAERRNLRAKLFGGRTRKSSGYDPGSLNAAFARRFLLEEGIKLVDASLGEDLARWIAFHPTTGRVQMRITADTVPAPRSPGAGSVARKAILTGLATSDTYRQENAASRSFPAQFEAVLTIAPPSQLRTLASSASGLMGFDR